MEFLQASSLTTGADVRTGTAGNDSFTALPTTLTTGDNLNGGNGTDTLSVTATLAADASSIGFSTSNLEQMSVNLVDADAANDHVLSLNMINASIPSIQLYGSSATTAGDGLTLTNVAEGTVVEMVGTNNVDLTVTYAAAFLAGTGDSATVKVNGVTATAAADSDITISAGIESLTVDSSSTASKIGDLVWGGATLNVTGDANLTIQDTLAITATKIDASTFTGKLAVTAGNANDATNPGAVDIADLTVTGGSGDDTLNVAAADAGVELLVDAGEGNDKVTIGADLDAAATATVGDVLNGGDGTDTLIMTSALAAGLTAAKTKGVSNFEVLQLSNALANNITAANVQATGLSTIVIPGGTGTLTMGAGTESNVAIAASLTGALTLVDTGTGISDAITLSNAATAADDMGDAQNIVSTGYETVNIVSTNFGATETQDFGTITLTADTGGTTAVYFSGTNKVTTGAITAAVIDASGMTAAATGTTFSMGAAAVGVTSIKGSAGADTLVGDTKSTIEGGAGNDTITGGSGDDTLHGDEGKDNITTGAGSDTVKGGDGDDTIVVAGNLSSGDKIDGGDGADILSATNASLTALKALTISEANTFNANFNGVEALTLTDALDQTSFDLGYLSGIEIVNITDFTGAETLAGLDSGNTVNHLAAVTNAAHVLTLSVNNAATGTTDVINVGLKNSGSVDYGVMALANIETINIDVTETTASTNVRVNTIGLTITQATGGAAQTLNVTGTESLTIDTAVAVSTIDASGMSNSAKTAAGLTMSTGYTKSQTITGSGGVDVLIGSTKADIISGGAGNDSITGGLGADAIDGGADSDTYITVAAQIGANAEGAGTGTTTGMVINLSDTAITAASAFTTAGQYLSSAVSSVAAGSTAYLFNTESALHSAVVDTLTNIENINVSGSNGINYIVGSDAANVITGGSGVDTITAGDGDDTIIGGASADTIDLGKGADTLVYSATTDGGAAGANTGYDTISGFVSTSDKLNFSGALATAIDQNGAGAEVAIQVADDAVDFTGVLATDFAAVILATGTVANSAALAPADFASIGAALGTVTTGGAEKFVFLVNTADGAAAGVYLATLAGANVDDLVDAEIQLLGIITDNIVAADVTFG